MRTETVSLPTVPQSRLSAPIGSISATVDRQRGRHRALPVEFDLLRPDAEHRRLAVLRLAGELVAVERDIGRRRRA